VKGYEYILCGLFGRRAIAQNAQGDAEHHRLMLQHQGAETLIVFEAVSQQCPYTHLYVALWNAGCNTLQGTWHEGNGRKKTEAEIDCRPTGRFPPRRH
jgi:hypothetical protein